jgi:hypothetical protein
MSSFAARFAGPMDSGRAGANSDSVAGEVSGDGPNGTIDGTMCRTIPQLLQKFAWLRLVARQRGQCNDNLMPHTSQK